MIKPSKKACEAVQKSREICNILCRGSAYGYGREAAMSFIRARIKEFLTNYFYEKNCNENTPYCEIDDDAVNEDVYIDLPYCHISWLTADGNIRVVYHNDKRAGIIANVEYSNKDAFRLFYDFDENKNYKDKENDAFDEVDEDYFNKYYKKSPEQIYDYLQTITCKRIIDVINNFYDKRLVKCNKIEPLEGVDIIKENEQLN